MDAARIPVQSQQEWVARIRAGDQAAFEEMFRAFAPGLCAFVTTHVDGRDIAEEIVQDLFFAMWRRRAELVIETSLSQYLFSAARNRAYDWLKRERTARQHRADVIGTLDERDPNAADEKSLITMLDLQESVERLPPRCRLIFTLSRQHGMTYDEIAKSLSLSVKTVEVQMGKALRLVRERQKEG